MPSQPTHVSDSLPMDQKVFAQLKLSMVAGVGSRKFQLLIDIVSGRKIDLQLLNSGRYFGIAPHAARFPHTLGGLL